MTAEILKLGQKYFLCRRVYIQDRILLYLLTFQKGIDGKCETRIKGELETVFLLVIINVFVGGMVGLERTILPEIAEVEFGIAAKTAILSFIIVFGVVKAITNYYTGALANNFGKKNC